MRPARPWTPDPKRRMFLAACAILCWPGAAPMALAASGSRLTVSATWCLAARSMANTAAYLVIENRGGAPDRLVAITSAAAQHISIHHTANANGVTTMTMVAGVLLPAHTTVAFSPGGYHIMLEALRRPLAVGEKVSITLWFKIGGPLHTQLIVVAHPPPYATAPPMRM